MLTARVFNTKMYQRTYFIFTINNQEVLPKIYQLYETTGKRYEQQEMLLGNTNSNVQKKDARNLE